MALEYRLTTHQGQPYRVDSILAVPGEREDGPG